ncbi:unnamed protein product [Parnassius apollo]|uniref:(apollo) hypothetical protein n=1 Tax=Parnassius apollo TaxID=110799 RepID=A0A8S3W8W0_PARAO|nr:unnamed protein product [Parnassius apollo]
MKRKEPASNDTTDTDDEIFSVHDSSDYCVDDDEQLLEEFERYFYDNESEIMQNIIENEKIQDQVLDQIEQESETRTMKTENRVQIEENRIITAENNTIEEENKTKQTVDLVQIKSENKTKKTEKLVEVENRITVITNTVQRTEENKKCNNIQTKGGKGPRIFNEKETVEIVENKEGDSVIVKYYEKKS